MFSILFLGASIFIVLVKGENFLPLKSSLYGHYFNYPAYKRLQNEQLGSCYLKCFDDNNCRSVNYDLVKEECELIHETRKDLPQFWVERSSSVHAETKDPESSSCKTILKLFPKALSGIYWIRLGNGNTQSPPFKVFCDMETDGGGWTLVFSYGFLKFNHFPRGSNGVTPFPNWPIDPAHVPTEVSTKVPLSETSHSAMNFSLWKQIGRDFLIKPTITNWYSCVPGIGDLVNWKTGSIQCKVVKKIASKCFDVVPASFGIGFCGVDFRSIYDKSMIRLDGSQHQCWPVHDPCGSGSSLNHVTNATNPGGAIYIR